MSAGMLAGVVRSAASRRLRRPFFSILWGLSWLTIAAAAAQVPASAPLDTLKRGFADPPPDARIMMRWWWFGPAVTNAELQRELRVMREGGIGGVEIQPVYALAPDDASAGIRNLPYLSKEFSDALRFASTTARELGLRADLTIGSGWPYGGPQVSIDRAAGRLRVERLVVAAGSDTARVPAIATGERLVAAFLAPNRAGDPSQELTDIHDGILRVPGGADTPRNLVFFIASRTGQMVKRAAVGAEGYVLDHFSAPSLAAYLKEVGDTLLQGFGPVAPYAVFCDSLEVYDSDWTSDFLDEFRRRRGYDLKPHLLELAGNVPALPAGSTATAPVGPTFRSGETASTSRATEALRNDWGRTLTELVNERFLAPMQQWARQHGTRFRIQGYGTPPATLSSNAFADLPEGEGAQWKTLSSTRWASSASHIYGVTVTSSETWTWLHSPVFRATPLDMKAEADLHFLQGINQLIGHGWPYTAEGVEYPGWRFYAAAVFDEKNPWWIVMPDIARYLQRVSFLLRQGNPVNDIAVYLPDDDAWAHMPLGRVNLIETLRARLGPDLVARIVETGHGLDFFDDDALRNKGKVGPAGRLLLGTNEYRAVILPGVERIPIATYRTLEEFAHGGGVIIATRRMPELAPGFAATGAEHEQVRATSRRLFQSGSGRLRFVQAEAADLASVLTELVPPDVALSPASAAVGFSHRRTGDADVFFLANTSNARHTGRAAFRVSGMNAEWWDPMTGTTKPAATETAPAGTSVDLDLEPYGSRILVFSKSLTQTRATTVRQPAPAGALDISADWTVTFQPAGIRVKMDRLRPWTDDAATRFFAGVATYEREVIVPKDLVDRGARAVIDFGEGRPVPPQTLRSGMQAWFDAPIREAAVIYLNDARVAAIWCPPYRVDLTSLLRSGTNRIRIEVANLAVNHMAGRSLPDYRLLNLRYGVRFEAQDMDKIQAVPAGLLGPIRIVVSR